MFKYYERLKTLPNNRLLSKAFQTDLHLSGYKSWYMYSYLVKTLRSAGVKENINLFDYETTDKKLTEFYMQQTIDKLDNLKLHDDSKLKLYSSIFSLDSNIPNYLKLNLKQSCTSIITKLRVSAHTLNTERGRYARPKLPRDKRSCRFCNEVDTETHFILFCKAYNTLRDVLFKAFDIDNSKLCTNNELDTLKLLLNPRNRAQTTQVSKYLSSAIQIRES